MDRPYSGFNSLCIIILVVMVCIVGACKQGKRPKTPSIHEQVRFSQVGIGVPKDHEIKNELEVNGTVLAEEILVQANVADYVFTPAYELKPLEFVEDFINKHHHLPGVAPKSAIEATGGKISVGQSYQALLEKIEELTLYTIEQNKRITALEKLLVE